ncbi:MAG: class I adenylate-forming enzyme family protein [Candidatus Omnitrophota bacterium]
MNIVDVIRRETELFGHATAVKDVSGSISYRELFAGVDRMACELRSQRIEKGQRVALLCHEGTDYIVVTLAVLAVGAVMVPVPYPSSDFEIETLLKEMRVHILIYDRTIYRQAAKDPVLAGTFFDRNLSVFFLKEQAFDPDAYFALNPAFIRFTSGTTGSSKGVVLSHEAILARTDAAAAGLDVKAGDIIIWVLSMAYHFVVTILLFLRRSATIVLCNRDFPEALWKGLKDHRATWMYATPFHYQAMTTSDAFTREMLAGVRRAVSTATRLSEVIARAFYEKFNVELSQAYGIIEVGLPCLNSSGEMTKRGSVGKILPGFEMRIDRADGDGIGVIQVKGPGMFDAYFTPWKTRHELQPDGWFNTGDLGRLDSEGFLFLMGREKQMINFMGMKIFPAEVENVLQQYPSIEEVQVYGVDHPSYGQLPVAKILLRKGSDLFDESDLRKFCYRRLSKYKVPKVFERVALLEKTRSGKALLKGKTGN